MRKEIHDLATNFESNAALNDIVYNGDLLEAFTTEKVSAVERYVDLPIRSLIALRARDFFQPLSTWREAVLGLHCENWENYREDIIRYFTSELYDQPFPLPDSEGPLRIGFAGGACYCKLGNHRVAANKLWLATHKDLSAVFRKVHCYYYPIIESLKHIMQRCLNSRYQLYFYEPLNHERHPAFLQNRNINRLVMVKNADNKKELYVLNPNEELDPIYRSGFLGLFKFDLYSRCLRLTFENVPKELMEMMLDESKSIDLLEGGEREERSAL